MTALAHFIRRCRVCCDVITQCCRCADPNKRVEWATCEKCKQKQRAGFTAFKPYDPDVDLFPATKMPTHDG